MRFAKLNDSMQSGRCLGAILRVRVRPISPSFLQFPPEKNLGELLLIEGTGECSCSSWICQIPASAATWEVNWSQGWAPGGLHTSIRKEIGEEQTAGSHNTSMSWIRYRKDIMRLLLSSRVSAIEKLGWAQASYSKTHVFMLLMPMVVESYLLSKLFA